ncbi:ABC transporter permease [Streptacidiphilus anmyonensis]|uniref:ABC transporter permease n=1 Tax=Streptacidiphilus anmyonensis TaxID=405782 RepID=UPI0005A86230|nr:ABC transporter permease [Streptacidiphilus anmyonensis]
MTFHLFRLECLRMLRDPRYLALGVVAPIGFYLLFATIFGGSPTQPGELKGTVEIMVAMAAYGAIWGALSATGPRLAHERSSGWLEQLRSMPVTVRQLLVAKLAAGLAVALPALVLVCLTAVAAKDVRLAAWQWAALVPAMWLGTLPFALLGVVVGLLVGPEAAFPLSYGVYMAASALGGLWVPPARLSAPLQDVAHTLPTYRLADLGWRVAAGHAPTWADVVVLAAWSAGFAALAVLAQGRRPGRARTGAASAATAG